LGESPVDDLLLFEQFLAASQHEHNSPWCTSSYKLPVCSYAELGLLYKHRNDFSTHGFVYEIIVMVSLQICLVAIGTG